jgi:hypothetical protein
MEKGLVTSHTVAERLVNITCWVFAIDLGGLLDVRNRL